MDIVASFKAALLQARRAELDLRATCLTELDDMKALKDFRKGLDAALERLRGEGKIPEDPLTEFLAQVSRVILWQSKLVEQEKYFSDRIKQSNRQIDELIAQGLPADHWAGLKSEVEGLEAEFKASQETWAGSRPDELWPVATSDAAREQLDDLIQNADNSGLLTEAVGWEGWEIDPGAPTEAKREEDREIPAQCSYCDEKLKFSFGLAGKEVECPECFADIILPAASKVVADERLQAETNRQAKNDAQRRNPGLPEGWKDHFDPDEEAKARLSARPAFDADQLAELLQRATEVEERLENWQKYFPRMTATGLPFDAKKAWDLLAEDPRALIGRMADEWPQEDWALSPRIAVLFADGKAGLSDAVALLATEKPDLEKQTRNEIRDCVRRMAPIISADDYKWQCSDDAKVRMTYTKLLDKKCPGHNWMRSFEVKEDVTEPFGEGVSVAEGLSTLLTGKSRKQEISGNELEDLFTRIRRLPEIAEDLYCDDGSQLADSRELPEDWRFRFWDEASFEKPDWITGNPLGALRLLSSDLPQIVAEYTGRQRLAQWRSKAAELLEDSELSIQRKAMLLPVVLGLADEPLFISEQIGREGSKHEIGEKPATLRAEVDRSFRSSEVREMLDNGFADKLALYCDQHWLIEKLQSEATTRRKGMNYGVMAVAVIAVAGVIWFLANFVMNKMEQARTAEELKQAEALAAMKVTYELDLSNIPNAYDPEDFVPRIDGKPVESGTQMDEGAYTVMIDHPNFETFSRKIVLSPGEGVNLGTIQLTPATGGLSITTDPPGALVTLGGADAGKTPLKLSDIRTGANAVTLNLPEFGIMRTNVVIAKGQSAEINYRFGRGHISFTTQPAGFMVAVGPGGAALDELEWKGDETPRTPHEIDTLPGSYTAAFVHPTMGSRVEENFGLADQQNLTVSHRFEVAPVNAELNGAKFWHGRHTLGKWVNWDSNWKLSTESPLNLLRIFKSGVQPRVVALQLKSGSFSSVFADLTPPSGTVECWGSEAKKQSIVPEAYQNAKFIDIAAGKNHTVGLLENGQVVCWGDNTYGQSRVTPNVGVCTMVAAGDNHTVVLKADGTVLAWGANNVGQAKVPDDLGLCVAISASGQRTAAIRADGSISGWGYGGYQIAPKSPWRPFVQVSLGLPYILTLDDQGSPSVYLQTQTQVGSPKKEVALLAAAGPCVDVVGGASNALLLKPDGQPVNITSNPRAPKMPTDTGPLIHIDGAYDRYAAVARDGSISVWGRKTGLSTRYGFERKTDEASRVQYWYRGGRYLKVVCGETHYVAIKR